MQHFRWHLDKTPHLKTYWHCPQDICKLFMHIPRSDWAIKSMGIPH